MSAGHVLVVGGGIVGIACAHYLRREGLDVTIIDQGRLGGACSSGNCGLVAPGHVLPLTMPGAVRSALTSILNPRASFRVKPQLRPALYRWLYEFARRCNTAQALAAAADLKRILDASADEYRGLMREAPLDAEWREAGTLYLFRTATAFKHFADEDVRPLEDFGVRIRHLDGNAIRQFEPGVLEGAVGGFHFEDDACVRPGALCQSWAERLAEAGVHILEHTAMTDLRGKAGRIEGIVTPGGVLEADQYVFALGAWSRALGSRLDIALPVEPGKGYSIVLDRPDPCPNLPILFPETRVVATPFAAGLRLGSMLEFAGWDSSLSAARLQQLIDSAAPYISLPADRRIREPWYGWRPMTWDSLPVIGRPRRVPNAIIATGHNMLGTTLAPATGRLVSDIAMERPPFIDAAAYSPNRF